MQLHRDIDKLRAAGAELHAIGNGPPHFIAGFREVTGYDGPLYTDPSLATFKAAQLKRSLARTFDPRALGKTIAALSHGQRQGRTQGDPWQQGGVLAVTPDGTVRYHHASERPGDNATVDQIVAALA